MRLDDQINELVDRYINGELSPSQSEEFEQLMEKDKEIKKLVDSRLMEDEFFIESPEVEDVDFNEVLTNPKAKDYFEYYTDPKNKEFYSSLKNISVDDTSETNNQQRINWFNPRIAAAILLLFASIFVFRLINPSNNLNQYKHYQDLPSLTMKSDSDELIQQADKAFKQKQYESASEQFALYIQNHGQLSDIENLYYAISLSETGQNSEAINQLEDLRSNSQSLVQADAIWYSALFALKNENNQQAKEFLNQYLEIPEAKYNKQAEKLLKKLN